MRTPYTFVLIRYMHDAVTEEFANIGVILFAPEVGFVGAHCTNKYRRISQFFGGVEGAYIKTLLRYIERGIERLRLDLANNLFAPEILPGDARACGERILPPDNSALQFSRVAGGITENPELALMRLFERYVDKYLASGQRKTRHDEDILPIFKKNLDAKALLGRLSAKVITTANYEHEFPIAWKNGIWNTCDAVSFDLATSGDIVEKANKWLGRATILQESAEQFRLILLLGEPSEQALLDACHKAENILRKSPGALQIIREREADMLAEIIEKDMREHTS